MPIKVFYDLDSNSVYLLEGRDVVTEVDLFHMEILDMEIRATLCDDITNPVEFMNGKGAVYLGEL